MIEETKYCDKELSESNDDVLVEEIPTTPKFQIIVAALYTLRSISISSEKNIEEDFALC